MKHLKALQVPSFETLYLVLALSVGAAVLNALHNVISVAG